MFINNEIVEEYQMILDTNDPYVGDLDVPEDEYVSAYNWIDRYVVHLKLHIKDNKILKAKFTATACTVVMASTHRLCRLIEGKTVEEALEISDKEFIKHFKLEDRKEKNNIRVEQTLNTTLLQIQDEND